MKLIPPNLDLVYEFNIRAPICTDYKKLNDFKKSLKKSESTEWLGPVVYQGKKYYTWSTINATSVNHTYWYIEDGRVIKNTPTEIL